MNIKTARQIALVTLCALVPPLHGMHHNHTNNLKIDNIIFNVVSPHNPRMLCGKPDNAQETIFILDDIDQKKICISRQPLGKKFPSLTGNFDKKTATFSLFILLQQRTSQEVDDADVTQLKNIVYAYLAMRP